MTKWELGLLIAGLTLLTILFTYLVCRTTLQLEEIMLRWSKENGYRIIQRESRYVFQGPFSTNRYRPVYYVTVEDQQGNQKKA